MIYVVLSALFLTVMGLALMMARSSGKQEVENDGLRDNIKIKDLQASIAARPVVPANDILDRMHNNDL